MEMKLNSLEDLYVEQLKDLYSAERQLIEALPKLAQAAQASDLKSAFNDHLQVTKEQANRLEQIFSRRGRTPTGEKCEGMEGLIREGEKFVNAMGVDPATRDAGLIAAAQRVEHYEISGYGTAKAYAKTLKHNDDARLLDKTLDEESATDEKLTKIAEKHVNENAMV